MTSPHGYQFPRNHTGTRAVTHDPRVDRLDRRVGKTGQPGKADQFQHFRSPD